MLIESAGASAAGRTAARSKIAVQTKHSGIAPFEIVGRVTSQMLPTFRADRSPAYRISPGAGWDRSAGGAGFERTNPFGGCQLDRRHLAKRSQLFLSGCILLWLRGASAPIREFTLGGPPTGEGLGQANLSANDTPYASS